MADNGATVSERTVTTEIVWHYLPEVPEPGVDVLIFHNGDPPVVEAWLDASGRWIDPKRPGNRPAIYAWAMFPSAPPLPDEAQP